MCLFSWLVQLVSMIDELVVSSCIFAGIAQYREVLSRCVIEDAVYDFLSFVDVVLHYS